MNKRILLKLSGESLGGSESNQYDKKALSAIIQSITSLRDSSYQLGVVVGAGNLFRGREAQSIGLPPIKADHLGMIATLMNGIMLKELLIQQGIQAEVLSSFSCSSFVQKYSVDLAQKLFSQGYILIFAGGTGHPFFTTDTAASLKACEMQADILLKATNVEGLFDKDPKQYQNAKHISFITYDEVLLQKLAVMDATAISICRDNHIPIRVFDYKQHSLKQIIDNPNIGTSISI